MDLNKLSLGEKIVSGAAIIFIISTFLPWFTISISAFGMSESESGSGWDLGFIWARFPAIIALVMIIAIVVDKLTTAELPKLPVTWGQLHLGLGALAAVLVLIKLIIGEDGGVPADELAMFEEMGGEISRSFGIFLGLIAAIGMAVGGYFMFNEEKAGGTTSTPPQAF